MPNMKGTTPIRPPKMKQAKNTDGYDAFFRCPKGHHLPHRVKGRGRCAPFDCCEAKDGAHGVVRQETKKEQAEALAYAETTGELRDMRDSMRAWNEEHPLPDVPPPPKTSSVREYMEKRLEHVMPLALERRIRKAVLDPSHQGEVAARELLNRGGYGERPEVRQQFQGPVLIVNVGAAEMKAQSPYASQGKQEVAHVEGKVVAGFAVEDGRRVDAAAAPKALEDGEVAVVHQPSGRVHDG